MSSDDNTIGMRTGRVIDSTISAVDEGIEDTGDLIVSGARKTRSYLGRAVDYVEDLWNNHATKLVLLILLFFALIWYRQEVIQASSDVTTSVVDTIGDAVGAVGDASGLSDTSPVAANVNNTLSPQVQPGELSVAAPATPAELAALFAA